MSSTVSGGVFQHLVVPSSHACGSYLLSLAQHKYSDEKRAEALRELAHLRKELAPWNHESPSLKRTIAFGKQNVLQKKREIVARILGIENFSDAIPKGSEKHYQSYGIVLDTEQEILEFGRDLKVSAEKIDEKLYGGLKYFHPSLWLEFVKMIPLAAVASKVSESSEFGVRQLAALVVISGIFGNFEQLISITKTQDRTFGIISKILSDPDRIKASSFYMGKKFSFRNNPSSSPSLENILTSAVKTFGRDAFGRFSLFGLAEYRDQKLDEIPDPKDIFIDIVLWHEEENTKLVIFVRECDQTPKFQSSRQRPSELSPFMVFNTSN